MVGNQGTYDAKGVQVFLRELTATDVTSRYLSWFQDEAVTQFLDARNLSYQAAIDYQKQGARTRAYFLFAVCVNKTRLHIGNIKIGPIDWGTMRSDLVTVIGDTAYWGKGIATEAISLGSRLAFDKYEIKELVGHIDPANMGSLKSYFRAGWGDTINVYEPTTAEAGLVRVSCFNPKYYTVSITEGKFQEVHKILPDSLTVTPSSSKSATGGLLGAHT